jgi:hypothetical protein
MNTQPANAELSQASALFTIGHLIGKDCLSKDFDIEVDSREYHISLIKSSQNGKHSTGDRAANFLKWTKQRLPTQPEQIAWTTRCSREDVARLSPNAERYDESVVTEIDPFTSAEFLKAAGVCLDDSDARLVRLSRKGERLLLVYETSSGRLQIEEYLVDWLRNRAVSLLCKDELAHVHSSKARTDVPS